MPVQHDVNAPMVKTSPLGHDNLHCSPFPRIVRANAPVANAWPMHRQHPARPKLA